MADFYQFVASHGVAALICVLFAVVGTWLFAEAF